MFDFRVSDIPDGWSFTTSNQIPPEGHRDFALGFGSGGPSAHARQPVMTVRLYLEAVNDFLGPYVSLDTCDVGVINEVKARIEKNNWDGVRRLLWTFFIGKLHGDGEFRRLIFAIFEEGIDRGRRRHQAEIRNFLRQLLGA